MTGSTATERAGKVAPGLILAFVCVAQFMVFTDVSIVNLALPSVQRGLHMSDVSLNYVVTAYGTVLGGFLLLSGRLADTYGRRRMMQAGLVVFALASLASGLSQNSVTLITARGFQGLGAAMLTTAALSTLTSTFPEGPQRAKALGIWGALTGMASIFGVILGGVLAGGPGWRWIFWINVPIGLLAAILAPFILQAGQKARTRERFDFPGAVTLTTGMLLLIFTLGQATQVGWGTARTIGGLVGAAAALVAFLIIESRTTSPLMPLGMFRNRTVSTANMSAVLVFGTMGGMFFFVSIFMQDAFGYSPMRAGFAYVPLAVCSAFGAGIASGLIAKRPARPLLIAGLALMVAGLMLLWRAPAGGTYPVDLLAPFLLVGLGSGMVFVTLQVAAFAGIAPEQAGVGAGLINTSQEAGGALGLAVAATIAYTGLAARLASAGGNPRLIRDAQAASDHRAFVITAGFAFVAMLLAIFLMPRQRHLPSDSDSPMVPVDAMADVKK
jgi:EmrB/QacA subfamily drug resistance transporter